MSPSLLLHSVAAVKGAVLDRKVVLVVDENADVRRVIAGALIHSGFDVLETADAIDSLSKAAKTAIDVVTIDVSGFSGEPSALVDQLRRKQPDLRALYIGGDHRSRFERDGVLHAPFLAHEIGEAVAALAFGRCRCPSCLRRDGARPA
jgi:CheY-like chemotaxis protein